MVLLVHLINKEVLEMRDTQKLALMLVGLSIVLLVLGGIALVCCGGNAAAQPTPTPTPTVTSSGVSTQASGGLSMATWIGIGVGIVLLIEIIILILLKWIRTRYY